MHLMQMQPAQPQHQGDKMRATQCRPEFYIRIDFIESLGWATVAREHLAVALDVLVVAVSRTLEHDVVCDRNSFEGNANYLFTIPAACGLRLAWAVEARAIGRTARQLEEDYRCAARGVLYSRGGGDLESLMRELIEKAGGPRASLNMTPRRIDQLAASMRQVARRASELAHLIFLSNEPSQPINLKRSRGPGLGVEPRRAPITIHG